MKIYLFMIVIMALIYLTYKLIIKFIEKLEKDQHNRYIQSRIEENKCIMKDHSRSLLRAFSDESKQSLEVRILQLQQEIEDLKNQLIK